MPSNDVTPVLPWKHFLKWPFVKKKIVPLAKSCCEVYGDKSNIGRFLYTHLKSKSGNYQLVL